MSRNLIEVSGLSYELPGGRMLFEGLSFGLNREKTGLVGRNGTGKSTLIKMLVKQLEQQVGSITVHGRVGYLGQKLEELGAGTVAEALEVKEKLHALARVDLGKEEENDYEIIGDDWDIKERVEVLLEKVGLGYIGLGRKIESLSGGEHVQLVLARELLKTPDYLILDEPTNNLDINARRRVYDLIEHYKGGVLVISHDRELLRRVDQVMELTSIGVNFYGGSYDLYYEEKQKQEEAAIKEYEESCREARKLEKRFSKEGGERKTNQVKAKKRAIKKGMSKIERKGAQGQAEQTDGKLRIRHERMMEEARVRRDEAFKKIELLSELRVDLEHTKIPNGKRILEVKGLCFGFNRTLFNNVNLRMVGPERVGLVGGNGSGKTTLVKLLMKELEPKEGVIDVFVNRVVYIDQKVSLMRREESLLENFRRFNDGVGETESRHTLAKYLFRREDVFKKIKDLSGGERLRAALACCLSGVQAPELLILDEPTNNLDLESIERVEVALKGYRGALIVISHDERFLEEIGVDREIRLK